jgi:hypothetical protein
LAEVEVIVLMLESAAKKTRFSKYHRAGHVRLIGENGYKTAKNEYRGAKTQPEEVHHRYLAAIEEAG